MPEDAVVYASFNKHAKITPHAFSAWTAVIKAVPGSVLWIKCVPEEARANLLKHASAAGVEQDRIIFTERIPYADHLRRLQLADLFLDTFPFNGGATASDALWAGLPLITLSGRGFASRMAGSLLTSIGLSDLIIENWETYQATAIELGLNPKKLKVLRERLASNRLSKPTFDTKLFTRNLEKAYQEMIKLEKPSSIVVQQHQTNKK